MTTRAPTEIDRLVGQRIRLARRMAKLSQSQLGASVGVTYQQIQKYENGTDRIGAGRLYQVSRVTDQPISFFYNEGDGHSADFGESGDLLADPKIQKLIASIAGINNRRLLDDLTRIADTFSTADPDNNLRD